MGRISNYLNIPADIDKYIHLLCPSKCHCSSKDLTHIHPHFLHRFRLRNLNFVIAGFSIYKLNSQNRNPLINGCNLSLNFSENLEFVAL